MNLIQKAVLTALSVLLISSVSGWAVAGAAPADRESYQSDSLRKSEAVRRVAHGIFNDKLLQKLKLDRETMMRKLAEGKSLAEIAEEQGVSRKKLKSLLTEAYDEHMKMRKKRFVEHLDQIIDAKRPWVKQPANPE
jgi:DNA-directed RNA polymerase specialized sigma24 family protein